MSHVGIENEHRKQHKRSKRQKRKEGESVNIVVAPVIQRRLVGSLLP